VYDPILCVTEQQALQAMGCEILPTNQDGNFAARKERPTLFYMPHCEAELYNNVLVANWGPALGQICILGNSLRSYAERLPLTRWETNMTAVARSLPYLEEFPVQNTYKPADVFNDTGFHVWPRIPQCPEDIEWQQSVSLAPLPMPAPSKEMKPKFTS